MMLGKIIKGVSGFYYVHTAEGEIYACRARGIFRERGIKPLVGDDVEFCVTDEAEKEGNIEDILPRKNELMRPPSANVDQAMALFAAAEPNPNLNILDKFLIIMDVSLIPCIVCFNKKDLAQPGQISQLLSIYENAGYEVMAISVKEHEGMDEVRHVLEGRTTILAGPSGAGKSSLTNAILGQAAVKTGEISRKIGRGKNTTRHTELFCAGPDTYLLDTPGFSSLLFDDGFMDEKDLKYYFPEFEKYKGGCRFGEDCMHMGEPVCGVKDAVEEGLIAESRYDDYRLFVKELRDQKKY